MTTAPAAAPAPSTLAMIAAIRTMQMAQARKIGAVCVAATKNDTTPSVADLATETGIMVGLDLAAEVLGAALLAGTA